MRTLCISSALVIGALGAAACTGTYAAGGAYGDPYPEPTYVEPVYKPDHEPVMSDAEIRDHLYERLATVSGLDLDSVTVHVHDSAVHFEGHVHSEAAVEELESIALEIPGVAHVDTADVEVARVHERPYRRSYQPHPYPY